MPAPSGVKLRESCEACAASKVRCSKDKPNCNRCVERSIKCHYSVTQRTGRKVRRRDNSSDSTELTSSGQKPVSLSSTTSSSPDQLAAPGAPYLGPSYGALHHSANHYTELDDFIATLPATSYLSHPASPGLDLYTHSHGSPEFTNSGDRIVADSIALHLTDMPLPAREYYSHSPNAPGAHGGAFRLTSPAIWTPRSSDPLGTLPGCVGLQQTDSLVTALRLMEQLCAADKAPFATAVPNSSYEDPALQSPSPQAVMELNKKVIGTVNATLEMPYSEDGYFLVVTCLVVSKVLSRYAAVAHGSYTPGWDSRRSSISTASTLLGKIDPKTAQCVLDELYSVQATVDQLGAKMQLSAVGNQAFGSESFSTDNESASTTLPFSATTLNQLYIEIRKRLSALSLEMLDQLKRYWT